MTLFYYKPLFYHGFRLSLLSIITWKLIPTFPPRNVHLQKFDLLLLVLLLHWLPVPYRIVFKLLLVVYKVINSLCSQHLADLLHQQKSSRNLRSNSRDSLVQPKSRTKTCGDSGPFAVCAPRIWNSLPLNIRHSSSVSSIQKNLKTFLFKHFVKSYSLVY